MLSVDEKKAIINYRIQKSYGNLNEAKEVAKLGFWNLVGNRFYYSAFLHYCWIRVLHLVFTVVRFT